MISIDFFHEFLLFSSRPVLDNPEFVRGYLRAGLHDGIRNSRVVQMSGIRKRYHPEPEGRGVLDIAWQTAIPSQGFEPRPLCGPGHIGGHKSHGHAESGPSWSWLLEALELHR